MRVIDFVEGLMPNGWSDRDNMEAVAAEVEVMLEEIGDEVVVREIVSGMFEAVKEEFGV